MAAGQCVKACIHGQEGQLLLRPKKMWSKWLSGIIIGARPGGVSVIYVTAPGTFSRVYRESGGKKPAKAVETRGEWPDWFKLTRLYNSSMETSTSERTTSRTLKWIGYSSKRPQRVPLLSAKNRKLRLQWMQAHQNWTVEDCKKCHLVWQMLISAVTYRQQCQNLV